MDKAITRKYLGLIAFAGLMLLLVFNFGVVWKSLTVFAAFFKPLVIGIVFAFILNKPCMAIDGMLSRLFGSGKRRLARGLALLITYLLFFLLVCLIIIFIVPQIISSSQIFVHNLSGYLANSQQWVNRVSEIWDLNKIDLSAYTSQGLEYAKNVLGNLSGLFSSIIGITAGVIEFFFNMAIAFIFSIYLLADKERILRNFQRTAVAYLPPRIYQRLLYYYRVTIDVFNKFVYGQMLEAVSIGALCFIGMLIFRFDYPLMISTLIAVTTLVPMIGAYIGGTVAFFVLAVISPVKGMWFIVFLIGLQQIEGNLIYPRIVGSSLGLPGIWVLLAALVGAGLAGPLGILLGVPIATILYTLLKNDVRLKEAAESTQPEE